MDKLMIDFEKLDFSKFTKKQMCKCSTCGGEFKVDDCDSSYDHHDGWEMPAYTEVYCPVCEDGGCLDDFWYVD